MYSSFREYYQEEVKPQWAEHKHEIMNNGGFSLYWLQITNHMLLLTFSYGILNFLNPLEDFIQAQGINIFIIAVTLCVKKMFKERFPKFLDELLTGNFIYKFNLWFNIKFFLIFFILSCLLTFMTILPKKYEKSA